MLSLQEAAMYVRLGEMRSGWVGDGLPALRTRARAAATASLQARRTGATTLAHHHAITRVPICWRRCLAMHGPTPQPASASPFFHPYRVSLPLPFPFYISSVRVTLGTLPHSRGGGNVQIQRKMGVTFDISLIIRTDMP